MNATTNVYRAQVLDPLATPTIDLSINVDTSRLTSTVLTEGGIFQYRFHLMKFTVQSISLSVSYVCPY
jgi:hypothetical protein